MHTDNNLVEIICTPLSQGNDIFDWSKVNLEHIAVESHLSHIRRKVANTHIRHTLPDFCLFVWEWPTTRSNMRKH